MEYLNRGECPHWASVFTGAESSKKPRWWLLHTQAHRRFLSLSPPTDQALGLCCKSRSGKRVPARKKQNQNPLWRSSPGWVHQDARPRVPMATSAPHSLLCLTEGLKLFTDSGHKQLKVQQGYESKQGWGIESVHYWTVEA